jgi:hypothetical protein
MGVLLISKAIVEGARQNMEENGICVELVDPASLAMNGGPHHRFYMEGYILRELL